jgi:hypothetical protein
VCVRVCVWCCGPLFGAPPQGGPRGKGLECWRDERPLDAPAPPSQAGLKAGFGPDGPPPGFGGFGGAYAAGQPGAGAGAGAGGFSSEDAYNIFEQIFGSRGFRGGAKAADSGAGGGVFGGFEGFEGLGAGGAAQGFGSAFGGGAGAYDAAEPPGPRPRKGEDIT